MDTLKNSSNIWQTILDSKNILIISHRNPDVDAISSSLAMHGLLLLYGKKSKIVNYSKPSKECDYLNGFKNIKNILPTKYDLIISLDCASIDRFGFELDLTQTTINIDHHETNTMFGSLNMVNSDAVSTTQVIYDLIIDNNLEINRPIAEAIYSGIFKDSGYFQYERVNERVFEIVAKLNKYRISPSQIATNLIQRDSLAKVRAKAKILDTLTLYFEGYVATICLSKDVVDATGCTTLEVKDSIKDILNIDIVKIALFFREINPNKTIVSIRSKNGVNISSLSKELGGGGHKYAAGATIDLDLDDSIKLILEKIKRSILL